MATNTYVALDSQVLSSTASSVTFSNISQAYTDLVVQITSSTSGDMYFRMNGDTGANYSVNSVYAYSAFGGFVSSNATSLMMNYGSNNGNFFSTLHIMNYSNTTNYKIAMWRDGSSGITTDLFVGGWRNNAAITSLTFTPPSTWAVGSTFHLYGIAREGITATTKATGGDSITTVGGYTYHTFLNSGTFTPSQALTADYLVVAGGGGGGGNLGGGGGAGGLRSTVTATGGGGTLESALSLASGTAYTVTIGAGGGGGVSNARGTNGSNSVFSTITSTGGGGGGSDASPIALTGGSGGGGGTGAAGTANQGFAGSDRIGTDGYAFGGGGGAGAVGGTTANLIAGNGGAGVQITALATPTLTGANGGYYAGGGGGSYYNPSVQGTSGSGGLGGGGRGGLNLSSSNLVVPTNAIANTGGGGGGRGWASSSNNVKGDGGSGIVIVRYAI
jgi:hypothetical protein